MQASVENNIKGWLIIQYGGQTRPLFSKVPNREVKTKNILYILYNAFDSKILTAYSTAVPQVSGTILESEHMFVCSADICFRVQPISMFNMYVLYQLFSTHVTSFAQFEARCRCVKMPKIYINLSILDIP